jgi:Uma2 family endonuclease
MKTRVKATVADYLKLPEGAPYQLINGELYEMPAPKVIHQKLLGKIYNRLSTFVEEHNKGIILFAPLDVFLDDDNTYQPDILFISKAKEDMIEEDGVHGAPDLVIEILSPSTMYEDFKDKFQNYEKYGVLEYWIIDPKDTEAVGFQLKEGKLTEFFKQKGKMKSELLDFEMEF